MSVIWDSVYFLQPDPNFWRTRARAYEWLMELMKSMKTVNWLGSKSMCDDVLGDKKGNVD